MTPTEIANLEVVRRYFDGCQTGDVALLRDTLADDVVHYFLPERFAPIRGAEHLARHWARFQRLLAPTWALDRLLARDDEVVSEWSCLWTPPDRGRPVMMRGTEWYVLAGRKLREIRAYLIDDPSRDTGLQGFPYAGRGYLVRS